MEGITRLRLLYSDVFHVIQFTQIACLFDHGISDRFFAYIEAVAVDVDRMILVRTVDLDIIGDRTDQRAAGDGECAIATNSRAVCGSSVACAVRVHPVLHRAAVHVEGGTGLQLYNGAHVSDFPIAPRFLSAPPIGIQLLSCVCAAVKHWVYGGATLIGKSRPSLFFNQLGNFFDWSVVK